MNNFGRVFSRVGLFLSGLKFAALCGAATALLLIGTEATALIIRPDPGTLTLPAQPIRLALYDSLGALKPVSGKGSWTLTANGSGGSVDHLTGLYTPGSRPGTDTIRYTDVSGGTATINVVLASPWIISPNPGSLTLPASAIQFSAYTLDMKGVRHPGPGTWTMAANGSGGTINAAKGRYAPGINSGTDTIQFTAADGLTASTNVTLNSPWVINPTPSSVLVSSNAIKFFAEAKGGGPVHRYSGTATWTLITNGSGGTINTVTGVYAPGSKAGVDTIQFKATDGLMATLNITVATTIQTGGPVRPPGGKGPLINTLTIDQTQRASVALGATTQYQAAVSSGQSYVVSLTGIVGAAQLKVFNDAALTQATTCISPDNLSNSIYRQPADCTFVATGSTVYATVTGTSYLATASNSYNIRVSPYFDAPAAIQGTESNPIEIPVNKPFGGTSGRTGYDSSYYMVNTTGRNGDVVISMTGLTGWTGGSKGDATIALSIFDNPKFNGPKFDNLSCNTPDFKTFAESCILPAGNIYYLRVTTGRAGGSFTLMVDSPPGTVAPPAAAAPTTTNVMQQALPASSMAP